jgi:hypothetical protein
MVQTPDSSEDNGECQFETVAIDQRDFSEEQWNKLEVLDLTEWTASKSWDCFCVTHGPEQWARETLFQNRINHGTASVSLMVLNEGLRKPCSRTE